MKAINLLTISFLFASVSFGQQSETHFISYENSPFGFHPAGIMENKRMNYSSAQDIGVKWARDGNYAFWNLDDPNLDGFYDFNGFIDPIKNVYINYDEQWSTIPPDMSILANISDRQLIDIVQSNPVQYADFVYKLVERYDGDEDPGCIIEDCGDCYKHGDGQYPSAEVIEALRANPIKYWQVGNQVGEDASLKKGVF